MDDRRLIGDYLLVNVVEEDVAARYYDIPAEDVERCAGPPKLKGQIQRE